MDMDITILCSKCGGQIWQRDNVYCEPCLDAKDEELGKLDEKLEEQEVTIYNLEQEILRLKGEINE